MPSAASVTFVHQESLPRQQFHGCRLVSLVQHPLCERLLPLNVEFFLHESVAVVRVLYQRGGETLTSDTGNLLPSLHVPSTIRAVQSVVDQTVHLLQVLLHLQV